MSSAAGDTVLLCLHTRRPGLPEVKICSTITPVHAAVVKLVYTLVSGTSGRKLVEVQVLSAAPGMIYR